MIPLLLLGLATVLTLPSPAPQWKERARFQREIMGISIKGEAIWMTDLRTGDLVLGDLATGREVKSRKTAATVPTGITRMGANLYYAARRQAFLYRLTPGQKDAPSPIPYYERWAHGLASDQKVLFVVDARGEKIHTVDPEDGTTIRSFPAPDTGIWGIAAGAGTLFVSSFIHNTVYVLDPATGWVLRSFPAPPGHISALAWDNGRLYAADQATGKIFMLEAPSDMKMVEDMPRTVRAQYRVVYAPVGRGRVRDLDIYLAVPPELPGQKILGALSFSPTPTNFLTDRWGQRVARFHYDELAEDRTVSVMWKGAFRLTRVRFQLRDLPVDGAPDMAAYLADDGKYDLASPTVTALSAKLGGTTPYSRALAAYRYLTGVIRYDRTGGWNNAARVLLRGTGSCSEYTFALVALLRKAKVPARYVGAIAERGGTWSFDDVYHRWAQAWLPGFGWVPMDANAGTGGTPASQGMAFGGRSNRHIVTTIGGGSSRYLGWNYNHNATYRSEGGLRLHETSYAQMVTQKNATDTPGCVVTQSPKPAVRIDPRNISTVPVMALPGPMAGHPAGNTQPLLKPSGTKNACRPQTSPGLLMYLVWGALMMFGGVALGLLWASRKGRPKKNRP